MSDRSAAIHALSQAQHTVKLAGDTLGGGDRTEGVERLVRAAALHLALARTPAEAAALLRDEADRIERIKPSSMLLT